jgi:SMI1 / KNR4 family (SUKH-1)
MATQQRHKRNNMKELTIAHRNDNVINDDIIKEFENKHNIQFPNYFIDFLKKYSGASTLENTYYKKSSNSYYTIVYFCELYSELNPSLSKLIEGNNFYEYLEWIPFGIDQGGWVFNLSISHTKYGQVWIDKFDSGEEYPFEYVASSFEEFINNLKTEEKSFS